MYTLLRDCLMRKISKFLIKNLQNYLSKARGLFLNFLRAPIILKVQFLRLMPELEIMLVA
jgi:hypothetical protein